MFGLWECLKKRWFGITVRKWRRKDALAIYGIEQQGQEESDERQLSLKTLFDQIKNALLYGAVATEGRTVKAFGGIWLGKTHEMVIYALQADGSDEDGKYRIALIQHFFSVRGRWGKIFLSMQISEDEETMRQFLMDKNGFVIAEMNECFEEVGDPAHFVYTMHYPRPEGYDPKRIPIFINGEPTGRFAGC